MFHLVKKKSATLCEVQGKNENAKGLSPASEDAFFIPKIIMAVHVSMYDVIKIHHMRKKKIIFYT